jgi:hypothetical protein
MDSHYDPEREAEAAMRLAIAADGLERQKWIGLAIAWRELAASDWHDVPLAPTRKLPSRNSAFTRSIVTDRIQQVADRGHRVFGPIPAGGA